MWECSIQQTRQTLWLSALLAPAVLLIHGYHPLADDGAVYVAGIKKLADPTLYPADAVFALSPTRLSIFAHLLAPLGHLPALLLICHLASIFLFLLGIGQISQKLSTIFLAACCFTLPIAGTSLCIMDPYVTARSFSTPLSLFAIAAVLNGRGKQALLWLGATALLHPLMAAYTGIAMLLLILVERGRWRWIASLAGAVFLMCGVIFLAARGADLSTAYSRAALSRSYFFLSSWQWYEYFGLAMPLLLLALAGARSTGRPRVLALSATVMGAGALLISLCFVHRSGSLLLARLQILRAFQFVYLAGVLVAGSWLRRPAAVAIACLACAVGLLAGQRLTYAASNHIEWPGLAPRNEWQQAFLWIRDHAPADAVFALDNDYIESPGEDSQGFRATAERSMIADWFKDGGIAVNSAAAAPLWWQGAQATAGLNKMPDRERLERLAPLGASWIVLPVEFPTGFPCPYRNARVQVCRLAVWPKDSAK